MDDDATVELPEVVVGLADAHLPNAFAHLADPAAPDDAASLAEDGSGPRVHFAYLASPERYRGVLQEDWLREGFDGKTLRLARHLKRSIDLKVPRLHGDAASLADATACDVTVYTLGTILEQVRQPFVLHRNESPLTRPYCRLLTCANKTRTRRGAISTSPRRVTRSSTSSAPSPSSTTSQVRTHQRQARPLLTRRF